CGARDGGELGMTSVALAYASETTPAPQMAFSERVARLLDRIDCRLIEKDDEREAVFRLRYDAYLREAAIPPNIPQTFSDAYDKSENGWMFGLYLDGELASSIRIHVGTADTPVFPSLPVFADLLEPELMAGRIVIDPTRFVTDPKLSKLHPGLPHVTLR